MYKLSRRKNLIPFVVLIILGLAGSVLLPPMFPDSVFEIPAFALFPAEIALVMMLSVFFFENATPAELIKVSFSMLAICMFAGAACNAHAPTSQTMPDATLLLNWVQLACMNVTGLVATIALYQTKANTADVKQPMKPVVREAATTKTLELPQADNVSSGSHAAAHESGEKFEIATGESAKEILSKLEDRFNNLETQRQAANAASSNSLSLESLFADESSAARSSNTKEPSPAKPAESLEALFGSADPDSSPEYTSSRKAPRSEAAQVEAQPVSEPKLDIPLSTEVKEDRAPQPAKAADVEPAEPPVKEVPLVTESSFDIGLDDLDFMGMSDTPSMAEPAADPAPAAAPPAAEANSDVPKLLFDDEALGGDLDDIFSSLAGADAQADFSPEKLAELKAEKDSPPSETPAPAEVPAAAEKAPAKSAGLLDDVSDDLDDIFKDLAPPGVQNDLGDMLEMVGSKEPAPAPASTPIPAPIVTEPAAAVSPAATPAPIVIEPAAAPVPAAVAETKPAAPVSAPATVSDTKPREVKEFGRLSAGATAKTELAAPGTLKTIGQMLLDTHAIENIIRRTEGKDSVQGTNSAATAKVVSVSRGADIQNMLNKICSYPGVDGCLVIGKDGLLIGATESLGFMRDVLGVLALGIHSTTNLGTKKVDMGDLRQAVMRTGEKLTILTEIGIGVLATFSDHWNLSALDGMMDHIARVVTDSQASGGASLPMETLSGGLLAAEPAAVPAPPPPPPPPPAAPKPAPEPAVTEAQSVTFSDDELSGLIDSVLAETAAPATTAAPVAETSGGNGASSVSVSDQDMTDLFDNLLEKNDSAVDLSMDFSPEPEKVAPAPAATPAPEPAPAAVAASTAAEPVKALEETVKKDPAKGQQIKEFGRLSAQAITQQTSTEGAIKAIGRQLIDVQAVENIIKSGEKREKMGSGLTTARVISAARGEGIRALLTKIDGANGVVGSLIVGNDGLVIASTLQGGLDKDLLGALCTAMHSHTDLAAKKLQMGKLRQIIFHCGDKLTILTGVAVGVLAVFVEGHEASQIDTLLSAIESTVRG